MDKQFYSGEGRHVLVTGGAGYIGSHTVIELFESGYIPVILDNFSNSSPQVVDRINAVTGASIAYYVADVNDRKATAEVFDRYDFDSIIHFADPTKAEHELGWKATKSLDDMTADTWSWQSQNPAGY